jgi:hypothetical protein
MSQRMKTPLIILAVLAAIGGYFYWQVDWEARAIRKQFQALTEVVEKDAPVSTFEALSRSRRLATFFTNPASIEYLRGRKLPEDLDALSAGFLSAWGRVSEASVAVLRHEITISDKGEEAQSDLTVRGRVVADGRDQVRDTINYRILWKKSEGDWRIQQVFPLN